MVEPVVFVGLGGGGRVIEPVGLLVSVGKGSCAVVGDRAGTVGSGVIVAKADDCGS